MDGNRIATITVTNLLKKYILALIPGMNILTSSYNKKHSCKKAVTRCHETCQHVDFFGSKSYVKRGD